MRAALLLVLLLMVPAAVAGPGHSGGANDVPKLYPLTVSVATGDVTGGNVLVPVESAAGVIVFSGYNKAAVPMEVLLYLEENVLTTWRFPPGQGTQVELFPVPTSGNVSVDFRPVGGETDDAHSMDFFVDWSNCDVYPIECFSKFLPWEVPDGATIFPYTTSAAGTYRATVTQPPVHDLRIELRDAAGSRVLAQTRDAVDGELVVEWAAESSTAYQIVAYSEAADRAKSYNEKNQFDPEAVRLNTVVEGPLAKSTPAPFALMLLALALAGSRRPKA